MGLKNNRWDEIQILIKVCLDFKFLISSIWGATCFGIITLKYATNFHITNGGGGSIFGVVWNSKFDLDIQMEKEKSVLFFFFAEFFIMKNH